MTAVFRTLAGQLILLFVGVLLIAQVVNIVMIVGERRLTARSVLYNAAIEEMAEEVERRASGDRRRGRVERTPGGPRIHFVVAPHADADRLRDGICMEEYGETLQQRLDALQVSVSRVKVCRGQSLPPPPRPEGRNGDRRPPDRFRSADRPGDRSGPPRRPPPDPSGPAGPGYERFVMSVQLPDGTWVNGISGHYPIENLTPRILLVTGAMLICAIAAVAFFARRISRPLTRLADTAEEFGRGRSVEAIEAEGPEDVRRTIQAFNTMQERLSRMIETQQVMLRSVGHDLRTPLTSLRIRAEILEPSEQKDKIIGTLDDMKTMMEEILTWAEDVSATEPAHPVDVTALLASLSDDYQDAGKDVRFPDMDPVILNCRRMSLKRAFQNLIDNGLKFGSRVRITLREEMDHVTVTFEDDGPGIPEGQMKEVLLPFVRLETSRSKETGGSGLGLSIVNSIIQAHGADLTLENRAEGGLKATVNLPL